MILDIFEFFVKCLKNIEILMFFSFFIILLFYVFKLLFKHFLTPGRFWKIFGNFVVFEICDLENLKKS